ncbi:hypothetical protein [Shinella sp. DD12]|uniref:hypothetical protein n=1 Tax=Shinella sp. DD12 TaxID=1410620 RepID=UPI00043793DD|nr:hypothetical protein [Shinella sp. DD12]EYR81440.1 hypothetical protein SHLA_15c001250 [Shinella sp. DD12]
MRRDDIVGACLSQFHADENSFELLLAYADGREIGHSLSRTAAQEIAVVFANEFSAALSEQTQPVATGWDLVKGLENGSIALNEDMKPYHAHPPRSSLVDNSHAIEEVVTLSPHEAEKIAKRLEFDASWDKCGEGYYSIKRQLSSLRPAGVGSAISSTGNPSPDAHLEGWTGNKCEPCKGHGVRMQDGEERRCPECSGTGDEYGPKFPHLAGDDDIGPYEQALRDAVEPFLDWLEQREEGAHIKEVREGLIGVEDVIPDDQVVLGAHPRAQKDQGVLTIGHFRRLQAAYDGNAAPATETLGGCDG